MDEFRRKPVNRLQPASPPSPTPPSAPEPEIDVSAVDISDTPVNDGPPSQVPKKKNIKRIILWIASVLIGLTLLGVAAIAIWYNIQLSPVDSTRTEKTRVEIVSGASPSEIADTLKDHDLIRSQTAFLWYTRLTGVQNFLQAGTYRLSSSESTPAIVEHLKAGKVDSFDITFLPGATLADNKKAFLDAGYTEAEVTAGFMATYESPLFTGKPAGTDLEGYIYGETYTFGVGASVEDILTHVFETYYQVIQGNELEAKFTTQGLSLFQGITLASIVQREAIGGDEPQIAQVFLSRLSIGMVLGSDVTYQYIADKTGVPRDTNLDSPYNTRRYAGLPPGPISAPGLKALQAVGSPAQGDYLYFLSGDDDVTYFARTFEEHQANIADHCKVKCTIL